MNADIGPDKLVEFETENIHLDIPRKGTVTEDGMWKILPLIFPLEVTISLKRYTNIHAQNLCFR